jgi:low affinity Fe/Cu permease
VLELLEGLASLLKSYGPWALVAILGVVVWRMAVYIQLIQTRHQDTVQKLLLDHNKEQKEETKQLVTVMTLTEKSLHAMNDTLRALTQRRE